MACGFWQMDKYLQVIALNHFQHKCSCDVRLNDRRRKEEWLCQCLIPCNGNSTFATVNDFQILSKTNEGINGNFNQFQQG